MIFISWGAILFGAACFLAGLAAGRRGRTDADAIDEADCLLQETFEQLDHENDRDGWFAVRITKVREALSDRPAS